MKEIIQTYAQLFNKEEKENFDKEIRTLKTKN